MSASGEVLVGLVILIGLVGIVLPVLPGAVLVLGAILVWAYAVGTWVGWATFAVAVAVILVSQVGKYVVPGRRLAADEVPRRTLLAGSLLGIIGFFVVPVIGLPLGFVLGVYAVERARLGAHARARRSTKAALRAVGLSLLIELLGAQIAAGSWLVVAVLTG